MKRILTVLIVTAALARVTVAEPIDPDLAAQVRTAVEKGVTFLKGQQKENGSWSEENMPALTALPLWAIAASGLPGTEAVQDKAIASLLGNQKPDGGVYVLQERQGGGLGHYNTSVCVTALHPTGRQELTPAILNTP
ncbi:MAG: hypothetical protein FWH21_07510, partial [Kiritimatiellaeota bacterium]|nr:hypothetical protein [Kiritimatiellota bacterium]